MTLTENDYDLDGNDFWEVMQNEKDETLNNIKIIERLNEKIEEITKEINESPDTWQNHKLDLTAFRYYLQKIRGDPPTDVKQECPFDI